MPHTPGPQRGLFDADHDTVPVTPVLFCSTCYKPFVNESSHTRHVRYCSRRVRQRPRSCYSCNAAKTKCTFELPCSRCSRKGIDCSYATYHRPSTSAMLVTMSLPRSTGPLSPVKDLPNTIEHVQNQDASMINDLAMFEPVDYFSSSVENRFVDPTTSRSSDKETFSLHGLFSGPEDTWEQQPVVSQDLVTLNNKTGEEFATWCSWMRQGISLSLIAADGSASCKANEVATVHRIRPHAHQNADLVIQSLRSLPLMMRRRETFPWFIHPQSQLLSQNAGDLLPDALLNCMSVAQMFASRTKETRGLMWRSIRNECRHFASNLHDMTNLELLAAVQACMIYLIMYIVDHIPGNEEDGQTLMATLYDLYIVHKQNMLDCIATEQSLNSNSTWEDWILTESRRRLSCLWFLVGCVVCVKNGLTCDSSQSYRHIPLPASKLLWEASTRDAWAIEYEENCTSAHSGLTTIGDLIDAQNSCHTPSIARKLDKWNADTDSLGPLLNLVEGML